ncbi:metallophosphoesterase [Patescibacteria group bacterium]|nr:metallophosphoesterase [Patescibacteria group bacterium]MBU1868141.1 metallophosphoesterase [Patescibacteria group bacterium]
MIIVRLAILLLVGVICVATLYKLDVLSNEKVVDFGKGVLGTVSSKEGYEISWREKFRDILQKILATSKNSVLTKFKESLEIEEDEVSFSFALVSDSHEDVSFFPKVLQKVSDYQVDILIHLGDLSNAGSLVKLRQAKDFLDQSGLNYLVIPGDHDRNWVPNHDLQNFVEIFGETTYKNFVYEGICFILLDNSDHELGVGTGQMKWLKGSLLEANRLPIETILVFTHIPLYNGVFPDKVMGYSSSNAEVSQQREELLSLFEDFEVDYLFSGDVHHFSQYFEPESRLKMVTVGAACGEDCKNFLPQFVVVTVYKDGRIEIVPKPYKGLEDIR